MSVIDIRLIESGFVKTGLCSTLWVNADDSFRAGFFILHENLCLVIKLIDLTTPIATSMGSFKKSI